MGRAWIMALVVGAVACSPRSEASNTSAPDAGPEGGCWHRGRHHSDEERFPAGDGCNDCSCSTTLPDGAAGARCTVKGCAGDGGA